MKQVAKILSLIALGLVVNPNTLFFGGTIGYGIAKLPALSGTVM
jgi:hypothetical protein